METLQEKLAKLKEVTAMEPQTLTFAFERETKNTVRYQEQPEGSKPPVIGPLYVQKAALGAEPPKMLTVTLTAR